MRGLKARAPGYALRMGAEGARDAGSEVAGTP